MRVFFTEKPEVAPKPTKRELVEKEKAFEFLVDVKGKPGAKLTSTEEFVMEVTVDETGERLLKTSEVIELTEVKRKESKVTTESLEAELPMGKILTGALAVAVTVNAPDVGMGFDEGLSGQIFTAVISLEPIPEAQVIEAELKTDEVGVVSDVAPVDTVETMEGKEADEVTVKVSGTKVEVAPMKPEVTEMEHVEERVGGPEGKTGWLIIGSSK